MYLVDLRMLRYNSHVKLLIPSVGWVSTTSKTKRKKSWDFVRREKILMEQDARAAIEHNHDKLSNKV